MTKTLQRTVILTTTCFLTSQAVAQVASPKMPTFFARRDYPTRIFSDAVRVADVNGDGIPDLISSGIDAGSISVEIGNGDGTFRPGPSSSNIAGSDYFVTGDLDSNGTIDLAIATSGGVVVSLGNGDGTFEPGLLYAINDEVFSLVVGDFNGDGILDIAATGNSGVWLLTGIGNGTFNSPELAASLPGAASIAAADFNGDGKLDLVVGLTTANLNTGNGSAVLFGNGDGTFQVLPLAHPVRPLAVAAGPLTKGGPPGIALGVGQGGTYDVALYFGNGAGGFSGPKYVDVPGGYVLNSLAIGDVNGDGIPDLVSSGGYVVYGEGQGNFSQPVSHFIDPGGYDIALADLRNNGQTDIIIGSEYAPATTISVLLNQGHGRFEDGIWTAVNGGAGCGVKGDFNGDGRPDLAFNNSTGISILLGTGDVPALFIPGSNIPLAGAGCLVIGDLNGDGIPDLLVPANGTVVAYLGNGDGTFTLQSTTPTPSGGNLVLGDFNHDGKLDFTTSGNLLALGNGDGTFQTPAAIVANLPPYGFNGIAAGDINNDGWPDLVLTNNGDDSVTLTVLLNNHQGGFAQVPTRFGNDTYQPVLANLNGDGNLDLILATTREPTGVAIYLGNGKGEFAPQVPR
jgi:hypothetical protein